MQKAKKFFAAILVFVVILSTHAAAASGSTTVYITRTGEKYHSYGCGYLSRSCIEISLYDAVNCGYTPCSRCNPPILTYDEPEQPAEEVVEQEPTWYQTAPVEEVEAMEAYRNALKQTAESGAWSGSGKEEVEASEPEVAEPEAAPAIVIESDPKEAQEDGYVYTSQVGTVFHKIDCPKLPDYQRQKFSIEEALENGYLPCDVCNPLSGTDFKEKQSWKIDAGFFLWVIILAFIIAMYVAAIIYMKKREPPVAKARPLTQPAINETATRHDVTKEEYTQAMKIIGFGSGHPAVHEIAKIRGEKPWDTVRHYKKIIIDYENEHHPEARQKR